MMKLSIVIPVYNSSKILEKLITEINLNLSKKLLSGKKNNIANKQYPPYLKEGWL